MSRNIHLWKKNLKHKEAITTEVRRMATNVSTEVIVIDMEGLWHGEHSSTLMIY